MDLGLRDKIVLVTGGAKGIGAATVEAFLAEDCRVVLVDQDADIGTTLLKSRSPRVSIFKMTLRLQWNSNNDYRKRKLWLSKWNWDCRKF